MTDGVTASISVRVTAQDSKAPPIGGAVQSVNENFLLSLVAGSGAAGKSDGMFTRAINLAGSATVTDTLSALTDALGKSIALADVQAIYLEADASNVNNIVVGNAASHPWQGPFDAATDTVAIKPGGVLLLADPTGWAVTSGSSDQLKLTNSSSGAAVTGKLIVIGRTA